MKKITVFCQITVLMAVILSSCMVTYVAEKRIYHNLDADVVKQVMVGEAMVDVKYEATGTQNERLVSKDTFRWTLTYMGKKDNSVTIEYTEYSNDMIRDKFRREVHYDLSDTSVIMYKGMVIDVRGYTSNQIKFVVVEADEMGWKSGSVLDSKSTQFF